MQSTTIPVTPLTPQEIIKDQFDRALEAVADERGCDPEHLGTALTSTLENILLEVLRIGEERGEKIASIRTTVPDISTWISNELNEDEITQEYPAEHPWSKANSK